MRSGFLSSRGEVTAQNNWYWGAENPILADKLPVHVKNLVFGDRQVHAGLPEPSLTTTQLMLLNKIYLCPLSAVIHEVIATATSVWQPVNLLACKTVNMEQPHSSITSAGKKKRTVSLELNKYRTQNSRQLECTSASQVIKLRIRPMQQCLLWTYRYYSALRVAVTMATHACSCTGSERTSTSPLQNSALVLQWAVKRVTQYLRADWLSCSRD
jgi:hypothetical protein